MDVLLLQTMEFHGAVLQLVGEPVTNLVMVRLTRWTFFRVKLIFECEFKISWSLGPLGPWDPWDLGTPGTLGPPDLGTLGPWDSLTSSLLQHLLIIPLTSYHLLLSLPPLVWFG